MAHQESWYISNCISLKCVIPNCDRTSSAQFNDKLGAAEAAIQENFKWYDDYQSSYGSVALSETAVPSQAEANDEA